MPLCVCHDLSRLESHLAGHGDQTPNLLHLPNWLQDIACFPRATPAYALRNALPFAGILRDERARLRATQISGTVAFWKANRCHSNLLVHPESATGKSARCWQNTSCTEYPHKNIQGIPGPCSNLVFHLIWSNNMFQQQVSQKFQFQL